MAGIQISGLLANSAFDWKSVVDQLIEAESIPITTLQTEQAANTAQIDALSELESYLSDLQDTVQSMRADNLFSSRVVSSDTPGTTWRSTSSNGAALGTYVFHVTQLATQSQQRGSAGVGGPLHASSDVSGLTVANLRLATAVTAGTFTVNGARITVDTSDSLATVFDAIATATGGDVTAAYDPEADRVTLTSVSETPVVLGANNDSTNFLSALKLFNNGTDTVASASTLGVVKTSATLATAGLDTALSGQDGSGAGTFTVNGVSISYNINTDTVATVLSRINVSSAGVAAAYDTASNRFTLTNKNTGDFGLGLADTSGNLLAALGLTAAAGGTLQRGDNARFTVNGGAELSSTSNTLTASAHGISGLGVTVNTESTQTLSVESDTTSMQAVIENFIEKFNVIQDFVNTSTKISIAGGTVTQSVLTGNREVENWANELQDIAFAAITGVSETVTKLDDLGIDFDGTSLSGKLVLKDSSKLANALMQHPQDVQDYFLKANTGLVAKMYGYLTTAIRADLSKQTSLTASNTSLDTQIATLQSRLETQRTTLTNAFIAMLDAQSKADTQSTTLTNAFFSNNNND